LSRLWLRKTCFDTSGNFLRPTDLKTGNLNAPWGLAPRGKASQPLGWAILWDGLIKQLRIRSAAISSRRSWRADGTPLQFDGFVGSSATHRRRLLHRPASQTKRTVSLASSLRTKIRDTAHLGGARFLDRCQRVLSRRGACAHPPNFSECRFLVTVDVHHLEDF